MKNLFVLHIIEKYHCISLGVLGFRYVAATVCLCLLSAKSVQRQSSISDARPRIPYFVITEPYSLVYRMPARRGESANDKLLPSQFSIYMQKSLLDPDTHPDEKFTYRQKKLEPDKSLSLLRLNDISSEKSTKKYYYDAVENEKENAKSFKISRLYDFSSEYQTTKQTYFEDLQKVQESKTELRIMHQHGLSSDNKTTTIRKHYNHAQEIQGPKHSRPFDSSPEKRQTKLPFFQDFSKSIYGNINLSRNFPAFREKKPVLKSHTSKKHTVKRHDTSKKQDRTASKTLTINKYSTHTKGYSYTLLNDYDYPTSRQRIHTPSTIHRNTSETHHIIKKQPHSTTKKHQSTTKTHQSTTERHQSTTAIPHSTTKTHQSTTKPNHYTTKTHQGTKKRHLSTKTRHQSTAKRNQSTTKTHQSPTKRKQFTTKRHQIKIKTHQSITKRNQFTTKTHHSTTNKHTPSTRTTTEYKKRTFKKVQYKSKQSKHKNKHIKPKKLRSSYDKDRQADFQLYRQRQEIRTVAFFDSLTTESSKSEYEEDDALLRAYAGEDAECRYPFVMAVVNITGSRFCTATVIHKHWALTAAHCLEKTNDPYAVRYGDMTKPILESTSYRRIRAVVPHPTYVTMSFDKMYIHRNNIGLVLIDAITHLNPAKISAVDYSTMMGLPVTFVGYAAGLKTRTNAREYRSRKRDKTFKIAEGVISKCTGDLGEKFSTGGVCLAQTCGTLQSAVPEDSGGPFFVEEKVGGVLCSSNEKFLRYTPVCQYLGWIQTVIERLKHEAFVQTRETQFVTTGTTSMRKRKFGNR